MRPVRGRVGLDLGRFLPYVTAGVAMGEVEAGTRVPIVPGQPLGNSDINAGLVLGIGVDMKVTERIGLKLEYLHADLGDTVYFIPSQGQTGTVPASDVDMIRGAITFRF